MAERHTLRFLGRRLALPAAMVMALAVTGTVQWQPQRYTCRGERMTAVEIARLRGIDPSMLPALHAIRDMTPDDICQAPDAKLARALKKVAEPKPDHPGDAVAFRELSLRDESGTVPPDGLAKAHAQVAAMRAYSSALRGAPGGLEQQEAGITPQSWSWLGPGNVGGRIRSIVVHPTQTSTMFAGSVGGGIWRTDNGGASWAAVDDFMANLAVSTIVFRPGTPATMFAGTGEGFYNVDGIRGAGIFKSTDGGVTWAQLAATTGASYQYVNRLSMTADGAVLLAATRSGIFRSADQGSTFAATTGAGTDLYDLDCHPTDSLKAVASGRNTNAYYTTDGGLTWTAATGLPGTTGRRVEIAYATSAPSIVYASVDYDSSGNGNRGAIYKSIDGGATYALATVTSQPYLGNQGWYDNAIWVDPTNPNTLLVAGLDIYRSTDGGATLTKISQWYSAPLSAHADHHVMVSSPGYNGSSNKTVFFGNDGGVYKATDISTVTTTTGWTELNNNLGVTQFYGAAGNPSTGVIVGGTQDNGTLRFDPGAASPTEQWTTMYGGDGGWSAADPTDPLYFYGEYVYLNLHRSADGGLSSSYIYSGISDAASSQANFIAPFVLDPNAPSTMLAGGLSLWRSTNVKATTPAWTSIKASVSSYVSAIAVAPGNSDVIWVGHNNGNVYKTTNGTAGTPAWTQMDAASTPLPNRLVTRVTVDATDNNIVYVTFGGFSADNVYKTINGGTTWTDVTGSGVTGLPDVPVRDLEIHPNVHTWLYAATEVGVFTSENGGVSWYLPQDGPANVSVDELFFMNSKLVAVTHGRGLFMAQPTVAGQQTLSVSKAGAGTGRVTSSPAGIDCGVTCSGVFMGAAQVTLTATAGDDSVFAGWSGGGCSGTGTCTVTMNSGVSVTATFNAMPPITLAEALDNGALAFGTGLSVTWSGHSTSSAHAGGDAASSGDVSDSNYTYVDTTLVGPGTLRFWWKVSSESGYDFLTLYADGASTGTRISGQVDWTEVTYNVAAGTHTIKWEYRKDASVSVGTDTAWLDAVTYSGSTPSYTLSVAAAGTGSGSVASQVGLSPAVACTITAGAASGTCSGSYPSGTSVTLTASPAVGYAFTGWGGACTGTGTCTVSVTQAQNVTAAFAASASTYALSVSGTGAGSGSVASQVGLSPAVACTITAGSTSGTCSGTYPSATPVTLTATASPGSLFGGWSGACSGTGTCVVSMTQALNVTASFTPVSTSLLTVSGGGTGSGTVATGAGVSPAIACTVSAGSPSGSCTGSYANGTGVTLSATPAAGSVFSGWSGACSGTGACTVTMSQARGVVASFALSPNLQLTVGGAGTGAGVVITTGASPALSCGIAAGVATGTCSGAYAPGTSVTLFVNATAGSDFTGWSGACTGTGGCTVSMTQARSVVATFVSVSSHSLTLAAAGSGSGTVTSQAGLTPAVSCTVVDGVASGACDVPFAPNTSVTLTAVAEAGNTFGGWSGACAGTGTCTVSMIQSVLVRADFEAATHTVTVSGNGQGAGHVRTQNGASPALDCALDGVQATGVCSASYPTGTSLTMTAAPDAGASFTGWSGACAGTTECVVTLSTDLVVSAGFDGHVTRYLAEGASSSFFTTRIGMANVSPTETASATLRFQRRSGGEVPVTVTIPPMASHKVVTNLVQGLESDEFSTVIESDLPLAIHRVMSWDTQAYGSHSEAAIDSPATTWYFAEGSTKAGFQLFYLVQNPGAASADVEFSFLLPSGAPVVKRYAVAGGTRFNVWVNTISELVDVDLSAVVRSRNGVPVIVERAMYLNTPGQFFGAGHESAGVTAPATSWFLAEGATGSFFDTFVLLANPGLAPATVVAKYFLPSGATLQKSYVVPAQSRYTVWLDWEDPQLANTAVSTAVTSDVPILVERAMWWPGGYGAWQEAHNSFGATTTGTAWALGEGMVTGPPSNTETYVLLANTSTWSGRVAVSVLFDDGTAAVSKEFTVPPTSRLNVAVREQFPTAIGRSFGVYVESLPDGYQPPAQIVVEEAIYNDAAGVTWAAGCNSLAVRIR